MKFGVFCQLVTMSVCAGSVATLHAQGPRESSTIVFAADVVLERVELDERGVAVERVAETRYHIARTVTRGKHTTTLTYLPPRSIPTTAMPDPTEGMRVEFEEDGSAPRIYDKSGQRVEMGASAGPILPPVAITAANGHGLLMAAGARAERSRKLRQDLGAPAGKIRGLDRYLTQSDGRIQEVLVSADTVVPVEINVVNDSALESHSTFEYEALADGTLWRKRARTESVVPNRPGHRFVSQMTVSNVAGRP
jgi:hypothetical protein